MKKKICLALAALMVFSLGGCVKAVKLTSEEQVELVNVISENSDINIACISCEEKDDKYKDLVNESLANRADEDRPRVYMEFSLGPDQYGNTWSEKMWGALIRTCGGTNIAAGMEGASVEIAPEQVISSNPEVIIFTCSPRNDVSDNVVLGYGADGDLARQHLEAYKNREGWADLDAVKNNNMGALYHDLSRHIFDFAGAQFLAKMIQPEIFSDMDPEANLKEFFDRFMPVELDGVWTLSLN